MVQHGMSAVVPWRRGAHSSCACAVPSRRSKIMGTLLILRTEKEKLPNFKQGWRGDVGRARWPGDVGNSKNQKRKINTFYIRGGVGRWQTGVLGRPGEAFEVAEGACAQGVAEGACAHGAEGPTQNKNTIKRGYALSIIVRNGFPLFESSFKLNCRARPAVQCSAKYVF